MTKQPDATDPTRRTLLSRLKSWDDEKSWAEFESLYGTLIYNTALKSGLSDADAQDVKQDTLLAVSKAMLKFRYDSKLGSFKGWLLKTTRWKIIDHVNRVQKKNVASLKRSNLPSEGTATVERVADPASLAWDSVWEADYREALRAKALERVKRRVAPKTFQVYDLLVCREWPLPKITSTLGVTRAEVHLAKFRVSRLVRQEVRKLEKTAI